MAGETIKSNIITALDAGYSSVPESTQSYGSLIVQTGVIAVTAGTQLEVTDKLLMLRVPSNASIVSLKLFNTDLDTGATLLAVDIGLYATEKFSTYAEGAVIDVDAYASAVTTLTGANLSGTELMCEARSIASIGQPVYLDAGLTTDPQTQLDIALTVTVAPTTFASGTIVLQAIFAAK